MDFQDVSSLIGAITGGLSILGLVWFAAFWKGRVDSALEAINKTLTECPPHEVALMAKTLWDIYVIDALRARPDLAEQHSPWRLKQPEIIPAHLKTALDEIPLKTVCQEDVANGYLVVKTLGLGPIARMALQEHMTVQEAIAVLSTYLDMRARSNHTGPDVPKRG